MCVCVSVAVANGEIFKCNSIWYAILRWKTAATTTRGDEIWKEQEKERVRERGSEIARGRQRVCPAAAI